MYDLIIKYGKQPFGYNWSEGELDCCHFTANIMRDYFNKDYLAELRESYHSRKEALLLIKKLGYKDLIHMVSGILETEPMGAIEAQTGDVVAGNNTEKEPVIGICSGEYAFFTKEGSKIIKMHLEDCICSWRIN